jgi:hypothetical protein
MSVCLQVLLDAKVHHFKDEISQISTEATQVGKVAISCKAAIRLTSRKTSLPPPPPPHLMEVLLLIL